MKTDELETLKKVYENEIKFIEKIKTTGFIDFIGTQKPENERRLIMNKHTIDLDLIKSIADEFGIDLEVDFVKAIIMVFYNKGYSVLFTLHVGRMETIYHQNIIISKLEELRK